MKQISNENKGLDMTFEGQVQSRYLSTVQENDLVRLQEPEEESRCHGLDTAFRMLHITQPIRA